MSTALEICIAFVEVHEKQISHPAPDEIDLSKTARAELDEMLRFCQDAKRLIRDIAQPGRLLAEVPLAKTTWGKFYLQESRHFIQDHSDQWGKIG